MSAFAGPARVTNGLVFDYDMSNTNKSWIGRPSTNTCNYDTYNYTDGNATVTRGATPPIPTPVPGFEISKIQSNNGADTSMNILYTSSVDQVNGGVYTHSAWILLTAGTYCRVGQHWNPWDAGSAQYIPLNVWTRVSYTLTNGTNNYGNIANAYGTDGTIYVTAVQYEQGSTATPFMGGAGASRSTTQTIRDLTGKNTITATGLTYDSDGQFSFNGSTNHITAGALAGSFSQFTVSVWFYSTSVSNYRNPIDCNFNYNGTTGNIGPRLEQDSSGNLAWNVSGNTGNNNIYDNFTVRASGLPANTWHNAIITWTSGSANTYLNGVPVTVNASTPNGFVNVFNNVVIGKGFHLDSASTRSFTGKIPSVQIYNRVLTPAEVQQNFNATRSRYGI
jgi:hypothetical protein